MTHDCPSSRCAATSFESAGRPAGAPHCACAAAGASWAAAAAIAGAAGGGAGAWLSGAATAQKPRITASRQSAWGPAPADGRDCPAPAACGEAATWNAEEAMAVAADCHRLLPYPAVFWAAGAAGRSWLWKPYASCGAGAAQRSAEKLQARANGGELQSGMLQSTMPAGGTPGGVPLGPGLPPRA